MKRIMIVLILSMLLLPSIAWGTSQRKFYGEISGNDAGTLLFGSFVERLKPEFLKMTLDEEPERSGRVRHIFLEMKGATIGGVRIDSMFVEALDVKFNPTSRWKTDPIEIQNILKTYVEAVITERDINDNLRIKQIGEGDEKWRRIQLDFRPGGLYARGNYLADLKIMKLDILIELEGILKIVRRRQIWLDDYTIRVNRSRVPQGLTERAIGKIQPILDLEKFIFPVNLTSLEQDDEKIRIRSRVTPQNILGPTWRYFETKI